MTEKCRSLAVDLAAGRISQDEVNDIFEKLERAEAGVSAQLSAARAMGDEAKLVAAIEKRNRLQNILVERRLMERADAADKAMGKPHMGIQASMVGMHAPLPGAQLSVDSISSGIVASHVGGLKVDLERAGVFDAFAKMSGDLEVEVSRALWDLSLKEPKGVKVSKDAMEIAKIMRKYQEAGRQRQNRSGAYIRARQGYVVRQSHNAARMVRAKRDGWKNSVRNRLDYEAMDIGPDGVEKFLDSAYTAITSGIRLTKQISDVSKAFDGKGNLAKKASASRVLIFKSSDDWTGYNKEFGTGSLREAFMEGIHSAARSTALMQVFGTNPEAMLERVTAKLEKKYQSQPAKLKGFAGGIDNLKHQMAEIDGSVNFGSHTMGAQISQGLRMWQTMSKLGGAVVSAMADLPAIASNRSYQGRSIGGAWHDTLTSAVQGMAPGEKRQFMDLLGSGLESTLGGFVSRMESQDTFTGRMAKVMHFYFKANLLGPWTDSLKRGATAVVSRDLASNAGKSLADLTPEMQRLLSIYGIDGRKWEVARRAVREGPDGKMYLMPGDVDSVTGAPFSGLSKFQQQRLRDEVRENLFALMTNEADFSSPSPGAREQAIMRRGYAANSVPGQALRFMFQFKSFGITVLTKIMGRQLYGHTLGKMKLTGNMGLVNAIVGMSVMGYFVMQAKEILKGRDFRPVSPASILAGIMQGGGAGIYGDFLFGEVNRFGGGTLQTMAGPGIGSAVDVVDFLKMLRQGDAGGADAIRLLKSNLPFANLVYTKAAMDYLIWYQLQEMVNPGYLRRMEQRVKRENNQTFWAPPTSIVKTGGGFK